MQYDTLPCLIFSCCFNVSYSRDTHSLPWSSVAKWHESYHLQAFLSDWNGSSDIWLVRKCRLFLGQDSGTSRLVLDRTDTGHQELEDFTPRLSRRNPYADLQSATRSRYEVKNIIGSGSYGSVCKALRSTRLCMQPVRMCLDAEGFRAEVPNWTAKTWRDHPSVSTQVRRTTRSAIRMWPSRGFEPLKRKVSRNHSVVCCLPSLLNYVCFSIFTVSVGNLAGQTHVWRLGWLQANPAGNGHNDKAGSADTSFSTANPVYLHSTAGSVIPTSCRFMTSLSQSLWEDQFARRSQTVFMAFRFSVDEPLWWGHPTCGASTSCT